MHVSQCQNKGAHLNTIERFHIYSEYTNENHLNDNQNIFPNKIFDNILNPYLPSPPPPPRPSEWSHSPSPHTGSVFTNIRAKQLLRSSRSIRLHTPHPGYIYSDQWLKL
jgi:hypothetical protein